jgi:conjugal transfer pilus assembly protein TrbC
MNTRRFQALFASGLLLSMSVSFASDQVAVNGRDREWMKQQQNALQEFKDSLSGQTMTLHNRTWWRNCSRAFAMTRLRREGRTAHSGCHLLCQPRYPREGLLPMLQDAARLKIPATLRGLVDNDFRKTAAMMFELTKEDKNVGVQIDPTLYSDYHITAVPALVVTCPGHYDVIRGSLPLRDALGKIAEQGDCAATARRLLEAAR